MGALRALAELCAARETVAMFSFRSINGISHAIEEDTDEADLAAGPGLLAEAVVRQA